MYQTKEGVYRGACSSPAKIAPCIVNIMHYADNDRVSMALGKVDVVDVSRLLDLDRRKIRVGREVGTVVAAVRSMGATSSDAASVSFVCPRGEICCTVRGMALV